jgi:putative addiction module CopG family antidote
MYHILHIMSVKKQNTTIHASLTPTLYQFVDDLLESGLYGNVSEIIREALREKYENNQSKSQKLIRLRKALQIGLDQAGSGEFSDMSVEDIWHKVKNKKV